MYINLRVSVCVSGHRLLTANVYLFSSLLYIVKFPNAQHQSSNRFLLPANYHSWERAFASIPLWIPSLYLDIYGQIVIPLVFLFIIYMKGKINVYKYYPLSLVSNYLFIVLSLIFQFHKNQRL